jgi:hypothetical protein
MDGRSRDRGQVALDRPAALLRDPEGAAEQGLRSRRAERHQDARLHDRQLGLEPRPAGCDLGRIRPLVDAALATRRPLEVLHDVRDVRESALDACVLERTVEQAACRPNERPALDVLLIPGLLADKHDLGGRFALAEHGLRRVAPEVARATVRGRLAQGLDRRPLRNERRRAAVLGHREMYG